MMNQIYLIILLLFFTGLIPGTGKRAGMTADYYVSASGNGSGNGTQQAPFTLAQLNDAVLRPGDVVALKSGDEFEGTISIHQMGTPHQPIIITSYGQGAKPKIYGSKKVTGWKRHSGNIYKAPVKGNISQVFAGGKRMTAARYPNSAFPAGGYHFITSSDSTSFSSNDLKKMNYTGAKWYGRTNYWSTEIRDVVKSESTTLTLNSAPGFKLSPGEGFFLMNKLVFLDQPGEWFFDASENMLYLWGDTSNVRASAADYGITTDQSYITISNLELLHHNISVNLRGGRNITIDNVSMTYPDRYGIYEPGGSRNCTFSNNIITGANHGGIYAYSSHSLITGNIINETALFSNIGLSGNGDQNMGSAIYVAGNRGNNTISYNRIKNAGYNGIYFARENNVVEYNYIDSVLLLKSDGGGIYTSYTTEPGNHGSIVRNNIILNCVGEKYGFTSDRNLGEGIYLDEWSEEVTVTNNTIAHISNAGIRLHDNDKTTVTYNNIFDARYGMYIDKEHGSKNNTLMYNTIVAASGVNDYEPRQLHVRISNCSPRLDYNRYINPHAGKGVFRYSDNTYKSFPEWQAALKGDVSSIFSGQPFNKNEQIILHFNDSKDEKHYRVIGASDLDGNKITSITLGAYESIFLKGSFIIVE